MFIIGDVYQLIGHFFSIKALLNKLSLKPYHDKLNNCRISTPYQQPDVGRYHPQDLPGGPGQEGSQPQDQVGHPAVLPSAG